MCENRRFGIIQRTNPGRLLRDEVAQAFAEFHVDYKQNPKIIGRYERPVKIDFEVFGRTKNSLLQTLNVRTKNAIHSASTEVFSKWHDLQGLRTSKSFFTVLPSSSDIFREDDLNRLREYSDIIYFPEGRERFRDLPCL
jgi:hypothetical protein